MTQPPVWTRARDQQSKNGRRLTGAARFSVQSNYQVREPMARNWATVGAWEFRPPSTVMIWPVT